MSLLRGDTVQVYGEGGPPRKAVAFLNLNPARGELIIAGSSHNDRRGRLTKLRFSCSRVQTRRDRQLQSASLDGVLNLGRREGNPQHGDCRHTE